MMRDVNKFIGIPYKHNADGMDGSNCIGLCRLFYKEHGWVQDFDDGKPVDDEKGVKEWHRLVKYMRQHFTQIKENELQYGDIIIFDVAGDLHTGIYLFNGLLLAMQVPCDETSRSTIYRRFWWYPCFKRAYRRKREKNGDIDISTER